LRQGPGFARAEQGERRRVLRDRVHDKNPRLAVKLYGGDEYIQHNPLAANGFDAFIAFVESFTAAFPDIHIDIRRVIAECDLVVTHGILSGAPVFGQFDSKVVDIFRLDQNGKIVEHWDVLQRIPFAGRRRR